MEQDKPSTFKQSRNQEAENTRRQNRSRLFQQHRQTLLTHPHTESEVDLLQETTKWFQKNCQKPLQPQNEQEAHKRFVQDLGRIFNDPKKAQTYFKLVSTVKRVAEIKKKLPNNLQHQEFINRLNPWRNIRPAFLAPNIPHLNLVTTEMISLLFRLIRNESYQFDALWLLINDKKAYDFQIWVENEATKLFLHFIAKKKFELIEAVELAVQGVGIICQKASIFINKIIRMGGFDQLLDLYSRVNNTCIPQFKKLQVITRQTIVLFLKPVCSNGNNLDVETKIKLLKFCFQRRLRRVIDQPVLELLGNCSLESQRHINNEIGIVEIVKFLIGDRFRMRSSHANANARIYLKNLIENSIPQLLYNTIKKHQFIRNLEPLIIHVVNNIPFNRQEREANLLIALSISQDLLVFERKCRKGRQKEMLNQFKYLITGNSSNLLRNQRSPKGKTYNILINRYIYTDEDVDS